MKKICLSALFFALCVTNAHAARFDCATDTKPVVKLICSDPKTLELDSEMVSIFKQVVELIPESDTSTFTSNSVKWQNQELYQCKDTDCLMAAYQPRIVVLKAKLAEYRALADRNGTPVKGYVIPPEYRIENQKLPLTFKASFVRDVALCHGYRDMLNAAKYTEYPACERKVLPQYKDFKKIEWKEITDFDEVLKMQNREDQLFSSLYSSKMDKSNYPAYVDKLKKIFSENNAKFYKFNVDANFDGKIDTIYKSTGISAEKEKYNLCTTVSSYLIDDSTMKTSQDYNVYAIVNATEDVDFFFHKNQLFISSWQGRGSREELVIYTVTGRKDCVFNIQ